MYLKKKILFINILRTQALIALTNELVSQDIFYIFQFALRLYLKFN